MPIEEREGVIKYRATCRDARAPDIEPAQLAELNRQRVRLMNAGMLGQDPARYEGLGFGNMSWRTGASTGFYITATQTGGVSELSAEHIAWVVACEVECNQLDYVGRQAPSSEALSHGAWYGLHADISAVVHVHAPQIWYHAAALGLVQTPATVPYGTPAMAKALQQAWRSDKSHNAQTKTVVMAGHQDGVIVSAPSLAAACDTLLDLAMAAIQRQQ